MKKINQIDKYSQKRGNFLYKFGYPVMLFSLLSFSNFVQAQSNSTANTITPKAEVLSGDLISQLDRNLGIKLAQGYDSKVKNMIEDNFVLKDEYVRKFTEDFIVEEMKKNWGISKENQLLFIRSAIYLGMEEKELYDGEDGDENRLNEFEIAVDLIEDCGNDYMKKLKMCIEQHTERTKQRAEESRQRTQESISRIMSIDSTGLNILNDIYNKYKENPDIVKPEEIAKLRSEAPKIISDCKKYGIDYKALLPAEVRKFYGIE